MKLVMMFLIALLFVVSVACSQDVVGQAIDTVDDIDGAQCQRNSQCNGGQCINGYCVGGFECTQNSECVDECIDGTCGQIDADQLCAVSCAISRGTIVTNGGTTHDVVVGGGDYVSAGALEWRLSSYVSCQTPRAMIHILKRNYGEIISESYITLGEGETSSVLTHPTVADVQLTLTLNEIISVCQ